MVDPQGHERASSLESTADATFGPTADGEGGPLRVGRVFGGRYEVRGVLGRGGMGEVWLARDLKLQVEVALKVVRPERLADPGMMARLRTEVRSAREVASPHVCRVYDLVEAEGLECVSMEYVDGTTLRQVLGVRGPLSLEEAREIALQLLAGLGAIHEAGLVHRDVKPDNVMLTRAGRVVLMDFGIAKAVASGGTVAGTPAYWPPEQAAGAPADPRADVFAAGIVLAEMVALGGTREPDARRALWASLREEPPQVPEGAWAEAIRRAVARDPAQRYPSARALARALEEITSRVSGAEEAQPYPGLASFSEAEAGYFFGREAEVEAAWKRLPRRHLLAVVGPSGAGKSSFLRAGLIPAKPEGWAHLTCTPGDAPFVALGQALVPEISRDTDAMRQMLRFEDADVAVDLFRRWRGEHTEALVIVDQLEELFTLNPADVQARFASLLSRLVLEADVHVLVAMRDDFLMNCNRHESLKPLFAELTPLDPPAGEALRRGLVQPALKCGYRYEDEALVADMLGVVEGERGALPLLAFAAASLWERRDREFGLLTRAAHDAVGGVAGALAQHAEATLARVGTDRLPLVRELFRNLVTAQGTRAVRDVDELLTVFPEGQRADAETVVRALIDARLLTTFEAHATEPGRTAGRRVELVHESLLGSWPRLVHWRTEDESGAQLRDQLRQTARLWQEKGRPEDLLWTGTSYREYQMWRARYSGGLSEVEETFARAMAELAGRRRRRRRIAVAAVILLLAAGLVVVGSFWRESARETRRAEAETGHAEAAQLLALGRPKLADDPNAALSYAIASLERSDNDPARRLAVEALWQGPPAQLLPGQAGGTPVTLEWSPDGRWLALAGYGGVALVSREAGGWRKLSSSLELMGRMGFSADGRRLVTYARNAAPKGLRVWALPEGRLERNLGQADNAILIDECLLTFTDEGAPEREGPAAVRRLSLDEDAPEGKGPVVVRRLSLDGTSQDELGRWKPQDLVDYDIDPTGSWIVSNQGGRLVQQRLDALSSPGRVLGTNLSDATVWVRPWRNRVVTGDSSGNVRLWDVSSARLERTLKSPADARVIGLDPSGRFLAAGPDVAMPPRSVVLFDLAAPRSAQPVPLLGGNLDWLNQMRFSPDGSWLGSIHSGTLALWNLTGPRSMVLGRQKPPVVAVAFTRDGHLLSTSDEGVVRSWPMDPVAGDGTRDLWSRPGALIGLCPGGRSRTTVCRRGGAACRQAPGRTPGWIERDDV